MANLTDKLELGMPAGLNQTMPALPAPEVINPVEPQTELVLAETESRFSRIKRAGQLALAMNAVLPTNEVIRGGAFALTYGVLSHSPEAGALSLGLSTLAVEGAGSWAAAELLETGTGKRLSDAIQRKFKKPNSQNLSPTTKALTTFTLGSVVGMAVEQYEDPSRTAEQNKKFGLFSSIWLAGACAVGGAVGSNSIVPEAIKHPEISGSVLGSVIAIEAARSSIAKLRYPKKVEATETEMWQDRDQYYTYSLVKDKQVLAEAGVLEQDVWNEKGYGDLEEEGYMKHIEKSRTFAAFEDGKCIGLNRMFNAENDILPPFLDMDFYDDEEKAALTKGAYDGSIEELGTVAVLESARGKEVNTRLWRLAYRDAMARNIKTWGIIMEPERVEKLNQFHGFTFKQVGPAIDYQGGACAPHIMDLDEVTTKMQRKHPLNHFWFVRKSLKS